MALTKLGYHTWLPEQDGGELPDGVADVSAVKAVDSEVAAAIDEPDDIPNAVKVPTLEEEVADEQQEDTPDSADPRVESDTESGLFTSQPILD